MPELTRDKPLPEGYDRTDPEQVFARWLDVGASAPTVESDEHRSELLAAFRQGWQDKLARRGDFRRRGYSTLRGVSIAYMTGRLMAPYVGRTDGLDPKTPFYRL